MSAPTTYRQDWDPASQMYRVMEPARISRNHCEFMRWLAIRGMLEHEVAGRSQIQIDDANLWDDTEGVWCAGWHM